MRHLEGTLAPLKVGEYYRTGNVHKSVIKRD